MDKLLSITRHLPGGVRKIWLARDVKELSDLYDRRNAATKKLESAYMNIIKFANKQVRKGKVPPEGNPDLNPGEMTNGEPSVWSCYIPRAKRPTHRLGNMPFTGEKVDTIEWAQQEVSKLNAELEERRKNPQNYPPRRAAFILFQDQVAAHIFAQTLAHDQPLQMSGRHINVSPDDM